MFVRRTHHLGHILLSNFNPQISSRPYNAGRPAPSWLFSTLNYWRGHLLKNPTYILFPKLSTWPKLHSAADKIADYEKSALFPENFHTPIPDAQSPRKMPTANRPFSPSREPTPPPSLSSPTPDTTSP